MEKWIDFEIEYLFTVSAGIWAQHGDDPMICMMDEGVATDKRAR